MEQSGRRTNALRALLAEQGFEGKALRTLSFNVKEHYEDGEDRHGRYRRVFAGYEYSHRMKLEFPSDDAVLGRVLHALSQAEFAVEIHIGYTVSDPEAVKNELLGKAVTDAARKAEVLSRAAGLTLGQIQAVDYSWGEMDIELRSAELSSKCVEPLGAPMAGFEPDDIELEDTVTVLWEIA